MDVPPADLLIEIIGEAMQRPSPERESYVRGACLDPGTRTRAMNLLGALERAGRFMDGPAAGAAPIEGPGSVIGRYTLLGQIGEGGFGVVFKAHQREPVQREVALKVIKLGMDTRAVVARFEAERQALAMMDHPCIAKVLDAGATETGRPYFVMELVRGEPITRFCRDAGLGAERRLELFVDVCRAVQHAHTKGIIHRDLKPANILVSEVDGRALPRIIDFGIAKATGGSGARGETVTEGRPLIGTPEYMSPEQAQGPGIDVDTRADIYSLGVLLYELLTGATPSSGPELRSAPWEQMLRMIRETEPPLPSTRAATASRIGGAQRAPVQPSMLRGDLDWITMRCLEKDRARRYQTAESLAADLERHARGEPVVAAPPGRVYRMSKFVRRHRVGVAAGVLVSGSLLAGMGVALWQARVAQHERDAAETSRSETARIAEFQAARFEDVDPQVMGSRLREDVLREAGEAWAGLGAAERDSRVARLDRDLAGLNLTNVALASLDRNIFQKTIGAIDREFGATPRLQAELLYSTGQTLRQLGMHEEAHAILQRALSLFEREHGAAHKATLSCLAELGLLQLYSGSLDDAEASLRRAIDGQRALLGEDATGTLISSATLASVEKARGNLPKAEEGYLDVLARLERAGPNAEPELLVMVLSDLAITQMRRAKLQEAESHARRALELSRAAHGDEHASTLAALSNLAAILHARGELPEATTFAREVLETSRRVLGDRHPTVVPLLNNLAVMLSQQGRFEEAEPLQRESLAREREARSPSDPHALTAANNFGMLLMQRGDFAGASGVLGEAAAASLAGGEEARPVRAILLHHEAEALRLAGRIDEARPRAIEAVEMYRANPGWSQPEAWHARTILACILTARGEADAVIGIFEPVIGDARAATPPDEASVASAGSTLGWCLIELHEFSKAETFLRESVQIRARLIPPGTPARWRYFHVVSLLGGALTGRARDAGADVAARAALLAEAEALVLEGYHGLKDDPRVPAPPALVPRRDLNRDSWQRVVDLYETWDAVEPGKGYDEKAAQWRAQAGPPGDPPGR